jgi:hypothetical protein
MSILNIDAALVDLRHGTHTYHKHGLPRGHVPLEEVGQHRDAAGFVQALGASRV